MYQSVQLLSCVQLFAIPWTAAHQASLSITKSLSLLKFMSIELVMPSNHLILCHPLLLLPSIFPSIFSGNIKFTIFPLVSDQHIVGKYFEKFKIIFYITNAPPRAFIYFNENSA